MCSPCDLEHLGTALIEPQQLFWGAQCPSLGGHSPEAAASEMQKYHPESAKYRRQTESHYGLNLGQTERPINVTFLINMA